MMKTYFLDVKADEGPLNHFEVRFALDGEAIQHANNLRPRYGAHILTTIRA